MSRAWSIVVIVALLVLACGTEPPAGTESLTESELIVSAAASLTDAFGELESRFSQDHDGIDVLINSGPSSGLREQILEGAPVDVFASADRMNMEVLVEAGAVSDWQVFARNRLAIAVPAGNPAGVRGLDDFAREELLIGLCSAGVPCGDHARRALAAAGVVPVPDTHERDVRALLTKIESGDLDAGITYVTDVLSGGGEVEGIEIEPEHNVLAEYSIARVTGAPAPEAADDFLTFVLSDDGERILAGHGFLPP